LLTHLLTRLPGTLETWRQTGDAYLLWRLKQLIAAGELDAQGELKGMKDFEIKAKAGAPVGETAT